MLISILTGFAAGALHVLGGVDHLVAMAPTAMRQPGTAMRSGLAWGLGHSTGVLVLSTVAILVKDFAHLERMSSWAEFSVGLALLVVGAMAIRTALGLDIHTHQHNHRDGHAHEHVHLHIRGRHKHGHHPHAASSLGLLHGLAGASHLLAVIPALALPPLGALAYLATYLIGSIAAMGAVVALISQATLRVGQRALPLLVGSAGGLSIITGFFWLQKTSFQIL
ncbi:MAG: hydantoin utilization protein A [Prochlorococcus sp.]|nr:hydantoin utilization protein A [Prochlorococcaceae cyanobacterium ETNP18_MAG_1]